MTSLNNSHTETTVLNLICAYALISIHRVFFDFSLTVKAAPHECVIRTGQP